MEDALKVEWHALEYRGAWEIFTSSDRLVAAEIPRIAIAEEMVRLHNESLKDE